MIKDIKSRLLGKYLPESDAEFVPVPLTQCDDTGHYLLREVMIAFQSLFEKAKSKGIHLEIISSTRNFDRQKRIWEKKWNAETFQHHESGRLLSDFEKALKILQYSAMPGTSRHHWGTDFDLNSVEPEYFESKEGLAVHEWLKKNASEFGFFQPYTPKDEKRLFGYEHEPWHWSYLPISKGYLRLYQEIIAEKDLVGFEGDHLSLTLNVIEKYVKCIDKHLI